MSHREGRIIHDADSHLIEGRGWLESYASEYVRNNLDQGVFDLNMPALDPIMAAAGKAPRGARSGTHRSDESQHLRSPWEIQYVERLRCRR